MLIQIGHVSLFEQAYDMSYTSPMPIIWRQGRLGIRMSGLTFSEWIRKYNRQQMQHMKNRCCSQAEKCSWEYRRRANTGGLLLYISVSAQFRNCAVRFWTYDSLLNMKLWEKDGIVSTVAVANLVMKACSKESTAFIVIKNSMTKEQRLFIKLHRFIAHIPMWRFVQASKTGIQESCRIQSQSLESWKKDQNNAVI